MAERIAAHRREREGRGWQTFEAPDDPVTAIRTAAACPVVLVDCLTLWVNNLMFAAEQEAMELGEETVADRCRDLLLAAREHGGTVIFVTNELGMGIVPDNAAARRFRDLAGRANQVIAAGCDEVVFVVSGLPLTLKTT
jgi:adenosylcobinamide kinase/adenosylcobinamide-phosphate guanylyltransferase